MTLSKVIFKWKCTVFQKQETPKLNPIELLQTSNYGVKFENDLWPRMTFRRDIVHGNTIHYSRGLVFAFMCQHSVEKGQNTT